MNEAVGRCTLAVGCPRVERGSLEGWEYLTGVGRLSWYRILRPTDPTCAGLIGDFCESFPTTPPSPTCIWLREELVRWQRGCQNSAFVRDGLTACASANAWESDIWVRRFFLIKASEQACTSRCSIGSPSMLTSRRCRQGTTTHSWTAPRSLPRRTLHK